MWYNRIMKLRAPTIPQDEKMISANEALVSMCEEITAKNLTLQRKMKAQDRLYSATYAFTVALWFLSMVQGFTLLLK